MRAMEKGRVGRRLYRHRHGSMSGFQRRKGQEIFDFEKEVGGKLFPRQPLVRADGLG